MLSVQRYRCAEAYAGRLNYGTFGISGVLDSGAAVELFGSYSFLAALQAGVEPRAA